ncbi:pyridoxal phosphate-dependent decarboxylase family protein [Lacipirellula limnantheis]|uniref:L-2,4-diaminobutyrate decarboxylase n=1 Tax=Lacipirellula limnantheis TaxID=2528024 RepID=A0A517TXA5_9BACT|nr:pyridoxal-dependent decarboxylase [Lacipirellula limnantheis]QDT73002.1 L-2,4-diaminobutyrate decarboxylase [Lacipirellula limnantheis]
MDLDETSALIRDAAERAAAYHANLDARGVAPTAEALAALASFDEPFPEQPSSAAETLDLLDRIGSPATMATTGGRYFGFVNGAVLPGAMAAHMLATAWDQNAALSAMSPLASRVRAVASRWLVEALQLPRGAEAMFVGGATVANLCGLAAARDFVLAQSGWDAAADGLIGAPPVTVVVGDQAHSTIAKSLSIIGLGRKRATIVPTDEQGRIIAARLPHVNGPLIVVTQAGELNTGAFDPFPEIIDWARERRGWVHVDGAIGLWAAASPTRRYLTAGIADADSWATDGHKWLNVPYDSGIILIRDAALLRPSMSARADYLPDGELDPMHHTPQSSQRARAIDVWAALRTLGRTGLAELVDRCSDHACRFAAGLRAAGIEVLNEVVINQVLVGFEDEATTERVIARIQRSGECWCGGTVWKGRKAMRISVSSWATTSDDVERSLTAIIAAARESK